MLRLLLRIASSWALGWVCHTDTLSYTPTECSQPLTHTQPLGTTLGDCKPWFLEKRERFSALSWETATWRLRKTVRHHKHEQETNLWNVCPFCSYLVLLLADIAFSAQQESILPFCHHISSSFLLPDLVSILELVKKKMICFKLPVTNESTNAE